MIQKRDSIMDDITHNKSATGLRITRTIPLDMDVPAMRRDVSDRSNVQWLLRNLAVRNSEHPQFEAVQKKLKSLMGAFKS